jgi:ubiquinone/menaquinone biosynthesis C-methylase UbiE
MKTEQDYLKMQKDFYEAEAAKWSLENKDPVVGSYDAHNAWTDYDEFLFKDFDTTGQVALEYGCGPGRNLIRFAPRFERVDGVDIAQTNLDKARINLDAAGIEAYKLLLCDGKSIPVEDETYDVVFSVICLQHIPCYSIRFSIFKDVHRVLKPGGHFCFQMAYGGRGGMTSFYYENYTRATETNGGYDVAITSEDGLRSDLIDKIGFKDYKSDIRPLGPGDSHGAWIWVQVQK